MGIGGATMPATLMQPKIEIDHPQNDETLTGSHYSFRIGGDGLASMEVSIDRGPWHACRHSCGYWWYDWTGFGPGPHTLVARGQTRDGFSVGSAPRKFLVAKR
jgi:hypothetical protein